MFLRFILPFLAAIIISIACFQWFQTDFYCLDDADPYAFLGLILIGSGLFLCIGALANAWWKILLSALAGFLVSILVPYGYCSLLKKKRRLVQDQKYQKLEAAKKEIKPLIFGLNTLANDSDGKELL